MRISEMNWMMVEEYLKRDDRAVLPLGSTEQHAYLSLSVDSILAERLAVEAAEPLGVPVFPVLAYGITPYFRAFPGTITLRVETEMPCEQKPMSDVDKLRRLDPKSLREYLRDGNYGGLYQREDEEMMKVWRTGVEETRALLTEAWD